MNQPATIVRTPSTATIRMAATGVPPSESADPEGVKAATTAASVDSGVADASVAAEGSWAAVATGDDAVPPAPDPELPEPPAAGGGGWAEPAGGAGVGAGGTAGAGVGAGAFFDSKNKT